MSVKERLKKFIEFKQISVRKFELIVGFSHGYVNNIRISIQPDKVERIAKQFPDLDTGWLLTGEGEMLKNTEKQLGYADKVFFNADEIIVSREAWEMIKMQTETIMSQQRIIERLSEKE